MGDTGFDPFKLKIGNGMHPPKHRGWGRTILEQMKPKSDQFVDLPDQFKVTTLYNVARSFGWKVKCRKMTTGVYRVWRIK